MRNMFAFLAAAAALTISAPAAAAVELQTSGGLLTGAYNVNVGGTLFDVSFANGTCAQVFGACDSAHFAFTTQAGATSAAQALLDQVFTGVYDNPALTQGCGSSITSCLVWIPFAVPATNWNTMEAWNYVSEPSDEVAGPGSGGLGANFTPNGGNVWGVFTLSSARPAAVPEPATWAMMLLGFGSIGIAVRRKQKVSRTQIA